MWNEDGGRLYAPCTIILPLPANGVVGREGAPLGSRQSGSDFTGRFSRWGWLWWAPPGFVMVDIFFIMMAPLQRRIDKAWDELAGAYRDDLEDLERTFGLHLRSRYPQVRSKHEKGFLHYVDGEGNRLTLELAEATRNRHGWGGARLRGWRHGREVSLPGGHLYLTFARGLHPEWVALWTRFPWRRVVVVNDAFVAHTAATVFGNGSPAGAL